MLKVITVESLPLKMSELPPTDLPPNAPPLRLPLLVVAADWSTQPRKRWMIRAERQSDNRYLLFPPEPVGAVSSLLSRLEQQAAGEGVLVGFDFPIGWPVAYAEKTGLLHLREAFGHLGRGDWHNHFEQADEPTIRQPFFPPPHIARSKGAHGARLLTGLGLSSKSELLRRCDRPTVHRSGAESLFFTCGGKQVGLGAIVGWRDLLIPRRNQIRLWPFDGPLEMLLETPGVTVAEIYPAEAAAYFGFGRATGQTVSKRRDSDRVAFCQHLLEQWSRRFPHRLTDAARSWGEQGFLSEDAFDAFLGLLHVLEILTGRLPAAFPPDPEIKNWEGWILGLPIPAA